MARLFASMMFLSLGLVDDDAAYQKALKWVDRQITSVEQGPKYGDDRALRFATLDALEAAEAVLGKYGSRPSTSAILGRIHQALGNYAEAGAAFDLAGRRDLGDRARLFGSIKTKFEANHPKRFVANVARMGNRWVIVHSDRLADTDDIITPHQTVRITIQENGKNLYTTGSKRPDWDVSEYNETHVYIRDLDRDGRSEVVFIGIFYGASWTPSVLQVISEQPGKGWITSHPIVAHDPLWIDDLDRNGTIEVGGVNVIGVTLSHAEQPRWPEIYQWQKGKLSRADSKYPAYYRPLRKEIDDLLKEHGDDYMLLAYRGRCARIFGSMSQAASWERKALAAYEKARKEDGELGAAFASTIREVVRKDDCDTSSPY
jgi:hypothetical protein